ncbi:urease accessory protein UreD [Sphingobacterium daejeonense]|uniref:urease accessory protein UreD n=1 Tax=Sphingobacterium daejeonense TaxID=371142 RepID=UPI0010C50D34|nr:urease accessory protein UreD [Sphingobacterium daejeonense]VTQ06678.1 Urease accessory protein UreH [Sphingobacterium daejeonense]
MESAIKVNAEREGHKTVLKESYHSAPYKLTYYGSPTFHEHLEMIIMSASPGVMDGDILTIDVHAKEEAELKVFTQSFNKVHPMKEGATQLTTVHVDNDAILQYIPHPITPFKDSIFLAKNEIHLQKEGVLIWGDIICSGRVHMKESFVFTQLHSITKIFRNGKLIFIDNQFLSPAKQPIQKMLFFEGYTHQATLLFSSSFAKDLKLELDEILAQEYEDITYGFTQAADDVVIFRALGNNGELLYDFLLMLGQLCWEFSQHKISEKNQASTEQEKLKNKGNVEITSRNKENPKEIQSVKAKRQRSSKLRIKK